MKIIPLYEAKNRLSEYVKDARRAPIVITVNGRPAAALVALDGEDLESFLLANHPRFTAMLDRAHAAAREQGTTPLSAVEREVAAREREDVSSRDRSSRRSSSSRRGGPKPRKR